MKNSKQKKAFTLVEILTVVFLGSIIIMTAYSVYLMSYKSYKKQSASAELTQNARISLERMSRDLRQSPDIITPLPTDSQTSTSEIMFQDGHNLLAVPAPSCEYQYITYKIDSNGNLIRFTSHYHLTDQSVCVKYDPNQSQLEHKDLEQTKAEKLSQLQFWGVKPTVTIHLEVSDNQTTYQFETKTTARNI